MESEAMDQFSTIVLIVMMFLAWTRDLTWLFIGLVVILVLTSKSIGLAALFIAGAAITWLLNLKEYWVIVMILMALIVIAVKRKEGSSAGYYSPELLRLLGG
ncbi:hypothetical protein DRN74_00190 [Candidatus Micrarchaeota archaeon]|nr:MAG: hypothetical protein DRN74_00190 [Candidatus Micrarchaeota archaeon]